MDQQKRAGVGAFRLLPQIAREYTGNDPYMIRLRDTVQKWDCADIKGGG